ncbi:heavy metal-associated isoprenylated plant protein 39-like [Bidens hawaiensis]|uniref:heavy metal-associated isoprenylated plant protein 39-like n=1 Tax=Bidens hawaiensis TaxID=980011 RepID=UPI004049344C
MKKFILKLELNDDKDKRKAMKIVAALSGIDSITINMKEKSMTLIGTVDAISAISKLRKLWPTYLVSVGPAKEPEKKEPKKEEKKEEPKKEEPKKEEEKKEEPKQEEDEKKEEPKKEEDKEEPKKDEFIKEDDKKEEAPKEESKKDEPKEEKKIVPQEQIVGRIMPYRPYYPPMHTYYNYQPPHYHSIEENPNACVIC